LDLLALQHKFELLALLPKPDSHGYHQYFMISWAILPRSSPTQKARVCLGGAVTLLPHLMTTQL
jgi:hypothetical protein